MQGHLQASNLQVAGLALAGRTADDQYSSTLPASHQEAHPHCSITLRSAPGVNKAFRVEAQLLPYTGRWSLVSTTEELLDRKVAAPV
jgi:hypothetical protein